MGKLQNLYFFPRGFWPQPSRIGGREGDNPPHRYFWSLSKKVVGNYRWCHNFPFGKKTAFKSDMIFTEISISVDKCNGFTDSCGFRLIEFSPNLLGQEVPYPCKKKKKKMK